MAATLSDALDKNTDTIDDEDPSLILPVGQSFTEIAVYDRPGDKFYWAKIAQVRLLLFPPIPANQSPVVTLNVAPNGITLGQSTTFTATATDPDGVIVAGTFYVDNVPVATLTAAPFTYTYTPTSVGTHQIVFTGLDNGGATSSVSLPLVVVAAPVVQNPTPVISFAAVGNKTAGDPAVTLSATSTNAVTPITFTTSNGSAVAVNGATATFPAAGTATLTARQVAGNGYAGGSATQQVTVAPASTQEPVVALEINPQNIKLGDSSLLFASPSSANSTVVKVEFFDGVTSIGSVGSAPWQINYTPTAAGTRQLTAQATDALGQVGISAVAPLTVTAPTTFSLQLVPSGTNARDTLTLDPASQCIIGYNNPVQPSATAPGSSTMYIFFPDLQTQIGQLDFDPADAGHLCEAIIGTTHYQKNGSTGQALAFTNGNVLLAV